MGGDVHDGTRVSPVFRAEGGIVDFEFVDGVDGGLEGDLLIIGIVHIDSVDHENDGIIYAASGRWGKCTVARSRRLDCRQPADNGSGGRQARSQWPLRGSSLDRAFVDNRAQKSIIRIHQRRAPQDLDDLCRRITAINRKSCFAVGQLKYQGLLALDGVRPGAFTSTL